jgi:PAS domain S-box-containing protein
VSKAGVDAAARTAWYRRAFQDAATGIIIVAPDGRYLAVNRAYCSMLGYTEKELLSRDFASLTHPEDRDRSLDALREIIAGEIDHVDMVKRYLRKDGATVWCTIHAALVRDPAGQPLYSVTQVVDITDTISTRLALEQRGAVLEAVAFAADRFLAGTDWQQEIGPVLGKLGAATGAGRVTLWQDHRERGGYTAHLFFEWDAPGISRIADARRQVSLDPPVSPSAVAASRGEAVFVRRSDATDEERRLLDQAGAQSILGVPVMIDGRLWGHLGLHACDGEREWSPPVVDAVRVAGHLVGAAISRQRAMSALREFARDSVSVREEEGRRLSRRIHDELGQNLTALKMGLASLRRSVEEPARIEEMMGLLDETVARMREIAAELRPPVLDELGLTGAIEWIMEEFRRRSGIACEVRLSEDVALDAKRSIALCRILQEALANVVRHADAKRVSVVLERRPDGHVLEVRDDGRGIKEGALESGRSLGIVGMRERAESLGGELTVESRIGKGTTVRVWFPRPRVSLRRRR